MQIKLIKWLLICLVVVMSLGYSQAKESDERIKGGQGVPDTRATVYIYNHLRSGGMLLGGLSGSLPSVPIYFNGAELASLDSGFFFIAKLDPGKHTFRTDDQKSSIELDLKSGQTYYLRFEYQMGMTKPRERFVLVSNERGESEIRKLRPLPADKIKDRTRAVIIDTPLNHPTVENWKVTLVSAQRLERLEVFSPYTRGQVEIKAGKNEHFLKVALKIEYIGNETKVDTPIVSILGTGRKDKPIIYEPTTTIIEGKAGEASESLNQVVDFFIAGKSMTFGGGVFKFEGFPSRSSAILKRGTDFGTIYFLFKLPNDVSEPRLYFLGGSTPIVLEYKEAI